MHSGYQIPEFGHDITRHAKGAEISITVQDDSESTHEPDFLLWRRFHQSKAKLRGVTEMAALLAGFSIVGFP
ncbi:unnamed protein product [Allacma fusca]|uniref:Uncharacterized protein n=1 Tax=Allacma fusca TaxID=39272 RepID=A0A8J2JY39_9HEXA|nr:unnamed protein product [Allacma fusca]